jgi:uncharacterized protein DUF4340
MNARAAAVLVVLLVVLGGAALLYQRQEAERRPADVATLGQPLIKGLKVADIAAIRIAAPGSTLTLQRKDADWAIAERDGFPADADKVRRFVLDAIELKIGQTLPLAEKERPRLGLDDPGKKSATAATQVAFNDAGGKTLAALLVGKKYFKREPENPAKAPADGRYVMLPSDTKAAFVVSNPLAQASTRTADWIDRTAFQVEKVKSLEVRYPDGTGWRIERTADNADWKLADAKPGEKLELGKANAASYALSLLELADVAPKDAADTGLEQPTLVSATTLDGLAYEIKVGKLQGDNYYLGFRSSGELQKDPGDDKDRAERLKKIEARLPREKLLSEHVLLVPKAKLEDTLKKRDELLEKKDAAKK